jgi:hypothetical protein
VFLSVAGQLQLMSKSVAGQLQLMCFLGISGKFFGKLNLIENKAQHIKKDF